MGISDLEEIDENVGYESHPLNYQFLWGSIDELFGYEGERVHRIDTLVAEMNHLNNGKNVYITECIALGKSALTAFPGNEKLMLCLSSVLYRAGYVRYEVFRKRNKLMLRSRRVSDGRHG